MDRASLQRIETFPIPYEALREAVLNALIHRDYAITAPIQIKVFADHLKLWNPAVLPDGWDLAKLQADHASHPFNPDIDNAFFRAGEHRALLGGGRLPQAAHRARRAQRASQIE